MRVFERSNKSFGSAKESKIDLVDEVEGAKKNVISTLAGLEPTPPKGIDF
jgi:hypothetical protein